MRERLLDMLFYLYDCQDHPRVCGKDTARLRDSLDSEGSPPRMRERLGGKDAGAGDEWITPAYAGKTQSAYQRSRLSRDHPRVCGKDHFLFSFFMSVLGSPPRMRERPIPPLSQVSSFGITPAYAGKTRGIRQNRYASRDHPRVCGKDL